MKSKKEIQAELQADVNRIRATSRFSKPDVHSLSALKVEIQILGALLDLRDILQTIETKMNP